jgi:hypothetical protein
MNIHSSGTDCFEMMGEDKGAENLLPDKFPSSVTACGIVVISVKNSQP